jgi:excisionase family DNA binding protein
LLPVCKMPRFVHQFGLWRYREEVLDTELLSRRKLTHRAPLLLNRRRERYMGNQEVSERKRPQRANIPSEDKLLVGRVEAAEMLSISARALDYLVANRQLMSRRIGTRVLIPTSELKRFSRSDHPERLTG